MKVHILGASGSGVTTLGKALASKLSIPYFDSDDFFWQISDPPFTVRQNPIERNEELENQLAKCKNWIVGGSMINWQSSIPEQSNLIVFLWIPADIRIERLKKREFHRYGAIIYQNPERKKLFEDFISWASDYDHNLGISKRTLVTHEAWLKKLTIPILELRGDLSIEERISLMLKEISSL